MKAFGELKENEGLDFCLILLERKRPEWLLLSRQRLLWVLWEVRQRDLDK